MSKQSQRVYIERRMETLFKSAFPDVKIGYENTDFEEPENEVYGLFYIRGGRGVPVAGSNGRKVTVRYPGYVQVTFWSPDQSGCKLATTYSDKVGDIFELHRGRDDDGNVITFKAAETPDSAKVNGWYPTIIKIPFYRDEPRPVD